MEAHPQLMEVVIAAALVEATAIHQDPAANLLGGNVSGIRGRHFACFLGHLGEIDSSS